MHEMVLILRALGAKGRFSSQENCLAVVNWSLFFRLVIEHRVWHQVTQYMMRESIFCPVIVPLTEYCQKDKFLILATLAETTRIARLFNEKKIQYCVVKGVVLNQLIYPALDTRSCRDIDVWVEHQHFDQAIAELTALGYEKKTPNFEWRGFKKRYYLHHKHDMSFYHSQRKILVELHFKISYIDMSFFYPTLSMLQTVFLLHTPISTLMNDYHLLYLMLHGARHAWLRFRWLNDVALFIDSGHCNLLQVLHLAKKINCEHVVLHCLQLLAQWFRTDDVLENMLSSG